MLKQNIIEVQRKKNSMHTFVCVTVTERKREKDAGREYDIGVIMIVAEL